MKTSNEITSLSPVAGQISEWRDKMTKKFGARVLSMGVAALLTVGMLSASALAVDPCKHEDMKKGYCDDCRTQYAAVVGKNYYTNLKDAVKAADKTSEKSVTLLTDLNGEKLKLGDVHLTVDKEAVTIEKCTLSGSGEFVVLNKGNLTLNNTTITNTKGDYAIMTKGGTAVLNKVTMEAESAQVRMDGGKLELASTPVDGTVFVTNDRPGDFAVATGKAAEIADVSWISNSVSRPIYDSATLTWRMSGSIKNAVTVDKEDLVYNGQLQLPAVQVVLYGRELVEGVDYEVLCPIPDPLAAVYENDLEEAPEQPAPIHAGTYSLRVKGLGDYNGSFDAEFKIVEAVPVLNWNKDTDTVTYSGSAAALNAQVEVATADGKDYEGAINYTYRTAGSQDAFAVGLPVNAGTYEIMAAVEAFDNHEGAETQQVLVLTVEPKPVVPTVKVVAVGELLYNGKAHTPTVTLMDGTMEIPAGQYVVTYENNVNVGTAEVHMSAASGGNYVFTEEVAGKFIIEKAAQAAVTIEGAPAAVTYGDAPIQLKLNGGTTNGPVTWTILEGTNRAKVDEQGLVTILSVGKVVLQAEMAGDDNYQPVTAQWEFEVAPAVLTISEVQTENRAFDGTKVVKITKVALNGIVNYDAVHVNVDGLKGELSDSKAGVYSAVKLTEPKLMGEAAYCYKMALNAEGEKTAVTIAKADLTTALESVEVQMTVGTENVAAENLAGGMPKDAGALSFTNRVQSTAEGTQAIVLNWGVDANGKFTANIVNGKAGDKVTFEAAVASENYNPAVVKIVVTIGAKTVEAAKLSVTPAEKEMTYNGKEIKPTFTVKYDGAVLAEGTDYDVKYPTDLISAGEKEATLTFKGAYQGTANVKYTVNKAKLTVSGTKVEEKTYNGGTDANVTMGTVNGAVQGDDVKVTAKGAFNDKNSGNRTVTVTYKVEGKAAGNYVMAQETETLNAKITPVTAAQLNSAISGITAANATSVNRGALQTALERANAALGDTGLSEADKTNLNNVKYNAQSIMDRIDVAAAAAGTDSIRAAEKITSDNVKVENKAVLQQAKADLSYALNTYKANYTDKEISNLQNLQTRADSALAVITRVEGTVSLIDALPNDMGTVDSALVDSVETAKESYNKLTDYEKTLIGDNLTNKLTAAGLAAGVEGSVDAPVNTPQQIVSGNDKNEEAPETIKLPMGIFWGAVAMASLSALFFIIGKIKRSKEGNW